jgi:ABC-type bacteriocin/lantibiotic exporter with double-glycine peptidase domain
VTKRGRGIALVFALFILPCAARAEVNVEPECRMKNRPPGRCGWCAVETLARHHQIKALFGIVEEHATTADPEDLTALLDKVKVRYKVQQRGDLDTAVLRRACDDGLGAVVGFRPLHEGAGGHIVTLVDFGEETVKVIDPNDQDGRVRTMPRERFLYWWDGFTLVLQPERTVKTSAKK